jgi:hypothetical protein
MCVWCEVRAEVFVLFFAHEHTIAQYHLLKKLFFLPMDYIDAFVKNQLTIF